MSLLDLILPNRRRSTARFKISETRAHCAFPRPAAAAKTNDKKKWWSAAMQPKTILNSSNYYIYISKCSVKCTYTNILSRVFFLYGNRDEELYNIKCNSLIMMYITQVPVGILQDKILYPSLQCCSVLYIYIYATKPTPCRVWRCGVRRKTD